LIAASKAIAVGVALDLVLSWARTPRPPTQ